MGVLTRKALRELRVHRVQAIGLTFVVAAAVTLIGGGHRALAMLTLSRDAWCQRLDLADMEIRFGAEPPGIARAAAAVTGVRTTDERLVAEGVLELESGRAVPALLQVLPATPSMRLSRWAMLQGRYPSPGESAVVLDRSVCRLRNVQLGDMVTVRFDEHVRRLRVVGISLSPEHLLYPVHPEYSVPLRETIAVVGVSRAATEGIERAGNVNSLLVALDEGADIEAVRQRLVDELPLLVEEVTLRDEQMGLRYIDMILVDTDLYLDTVTFVMVLLAGALLVLVLARIVIRQRATTGTLVALGHRPARIAVSYGLLALVPATCGTAIGAVVGAAFARSLFDGYADGMGYAPLHDPGFGLPFVYAALGCATMAILAVGLPALVRARSWPARLLRPSRRSAATRRWGPLTRAMSRLHDVLRLPMSVVLGVTGVFRRMGTTAITALALGSTFTVAIALLLVHVSHRIEVQASVEQFGLDATAYFRDPVGPEVVADAAARARGSAEALISEFAHVVHRGQAFTQRVMCVAPGRWTSKLRMARGRRFEGAASAEILVDHWVADRHGIDVGDDLTCFPGPNAPEGVSLKVAGVLDGVSFGLVVMPLETGRSLFGLPGLATGAMVASPLAADELEAALRTVPHTENVFSLERASAEVQSNLEAGARGIVWGQAIAILIALVFLGVLAAFDAKESAPDLALLRALGWRNRPLAVLLLSGIVARGVLAFLVALVGATPLAAWILERITETHGYHMPLTVPVWIFPLVGGVFVAALPLCAWPAWRVARRLTAGRSVRMLVRE